MRIIWKPLLVAVIAWHLICLGVMAAFPYTLGRLVIALYTAWFGDIQDSFGRYDRINAYVGLTAITAIATACVFPIYDRLSGRRTTPRSKVVSFAAAQVPLMLALIWSYESGFASRLNELDWAIFGAPAEIYSFRNLVLHRLIAWQFSTTPILVIALWLHAKVASRPHRGSSFAGDVLKV